MRNDKLILSPDVNGFIPGWLVAGPIEFPLVGFGQFKDTSAIGEPYVNPSAGDSVISNIFEKEKNIWFIQSIDKKGLVDFNRSIEWQVDSKIPVKIWYAKAGYAYTNIISDYDKEVLLTFGSNSQAVVFLNREKIYSFQNTRNAVKDQDTIRVKLKKGSNELLIKVLNTQQNLGLAYFGTIKWEWGFYARLLEKNGKPADVKIVLNAGSDKSDFNAYSTFYFKNDNGKLKQRVDLEINSFNQFVKSAKFVIKSDTKSYEFEIDSINPGKTIHSVYIPEINNDFSINAKMILAGETIEKNLVLKKQKKYNMHLMLLNHTDVGYTHPQPICEEIHCNTIDDVLKTCKEYPDFRWTIETTWQLEAYEKLRSKEKFEELIALIKSGRVAVSPIYTNPFTGYISEEEMLRSFNKAIEYKKKYGITFLGAVYNDVPGQSWFLPQALKKAGIKLIAEGINEVYGDYKLQRSLPKIFKWESADGSQVITYLNEAYNEGKSYGLESGDMFCVEQSINERINKLEAKNYGQDVILINSSFSDNSIVATHQYHLAMQWNKEYEYPKFISSDINLFTDALINSEGYKSFPVLRGDWTSNWEIFFQGEFDRHKDARWVQHQLTSAEKISTLSAILNHGINPENKEIENAYRNLLQFDGHGSGLEYGYGSPEDNNLTIRYRQNYVDDALLGTEAVLLKGMYQISKPEESLEAEGLFLFNPLSWKRHELIEINFPFENSPEYDLVDAVTNKIIPSFRKGHIQYFISPEIPSFGYTKIILKPKSGKSDYKHFLKKTDSSIENQYYRISIDTLKSSVSSILDKKSGKELINTQSRFPFGTPVIGNQINQNYSVVPAKLKYEIIDESPVRMLIRITRDNDVIESSEFVLLDGNDKVFYNTSVNFNRLKQTKLAEEYDLPFNFNIQDAKVKSEILGGYINLDKDRLPGIDHDGVSLRRSVSIYNNDENIIWATADARVIRIKIDSLTNQPVILSNPVNNFPADWNRHEDNSGKIDFHYAFSSAKGGFNSAKTTMFGYELNTPVLSRKSWFNSVPSSLEYINIDNENIIMLNLKSSGEKTIIRLINSDNENTQSAKISTNLFSGFNAEMVDIYGNSKNKIRVFNNIIDVTLKPGEVQDILIFQNK